METTAPAHAAPMKQARPRRAAVALPATLHPEQRLPLAQVSALTGIGRSKTYELLSVGDFPRPEKHGTRCVRWRCGDVLDWLAARRGAQ